MNNAQLWRVLLILVAIYIGYIILQRIVFFLRTQVFSPLAKTRRQLKKYFKSQILTPMDEAIYVGDAEKMIQLAKQGDTVRDSMLWQLTSKKFPPYKVWVTEPMCRLLIKLGADVNFRWKEKSPGIIGYEVYETPLSNAIKARRVDLVELFLENQADPNTPLDNRHPLNKRIRYVLDLVEGDSDPECQAMKELLIQYGAKSDTIS